jgi:hypothetical protein
VRSLEEISKNLLGDFKTINSFLTTNAKSPTRDIHEWIFSQWLSATYGVTVATHRGKVHDYPGMIFDYSKKGKVMINMIKYIKTIINNFPEDITAIRTSPAVDHLFTVREKSMAKPLPEGTDESLPPRNSSTIVSECQSTMRHPACDGISDDKSKMPM